jgi:hypothetical protein
MPELAPLPEFAPELPLLVPGAPAGPARVRTAKGDVGRMEPARPAPGDGGVATRRGCEDGAGAPLANNEIAARRGRGPHRIKINNYGNRWAAVKMRDEAHRTVLSVFVGPRSTAQVRNFPSGRFRLEYALGERWSRRCGTFLDGMLSQRFPDFTEFPAPRPPRPMTMHAEYTITPVFAGNVQPQDVPNDEFAAEK